MHTTVIQPALYPWIDGTDVLPLEERVTTSELDFFVAVIDMIGHSLDYARRP